MDTLSEKLAASEYVVFYSSRPYASAARDSDRFPFSNNYYQSLFDGSLGYELDRSFTNYPELLGVSFRDDAISRAGLPHPEPLNPSEKSAINFNLGYADDNVVGYDHPTVLLFKNTGHLVKDVIGIRLKSIPQLSGREIGLMLLPDDLTSQQEGGTFSDIVDRDGWTNKLPVLAWILVVEIIYLLALPITMFIFRPLPDRGIILARIFGLLAVSYVAWLAVSLGWMDYSRYAVYLGLGVVAGLSLSTLAFRWREITDFLKKHWRLLVFSEALFLLAFLAFVSLRYANPDLWHPFRGGEKPMELAYLSAVVRSTTLPPFDPWFAGGYLNYYYWGYFVISSVIRVTGILPTTAFNLAVPLFFALTVTGSYTLVYNLTEGVRQRRSNRPIVDHPIALPGIGSLPELAHGAARSQWRHWIWSPVGAGLIAGLFTAVVGNLDGLVQLVQNSWHRVFDSTPFPAFDFWRSSRMVPNLENIDPNPLAFWVPERLPGYADISFHITEFSFFTFLFADLHAHMMVIPFTLLVIGLGLNLVIGLRDGGCLWTIVSAAALALGLGSLWVVNSWDFPSYLILTVGLLTLGVYFSRGTFTEKSALLAALAIGVVGLSILAFLPFHQTYETFNSGLDVSKWRTPVDRFLGIHGLFLFVIATFLLYQARDIFRDLLRSLRRQELDEPVAGFKWLRVMFSVGALLAVFFAAAGFWNVALLIVFVTLAVTAAWKTFTNEESEDERTFAVVPFVLLVLAFLIGIGVDLVRVEGDIGRMNTFFKYYLEIWVLLSVVSAYMLWHLGESGFLQTKLNWRSGVWLAVLVVLIGSSLIYTALGSRARVSDRFTDGPSTLDGTAYMARAVHWEQNQPFDLKWDREAIEWVQDNVHGSPVILEAHLSQYRWGARFANYTGLPTVIGWPWHQIQQRTNYAFAVQNRIEDVRDMYETSDEKRAVRLLKQYNVKYVVVGDLERITYPGAGLQKFENLGRKVFENQGTAIYESNWD
jgi:YYY domain-containing protein